MYRLLQIFQNFSPFGIAAFTASALLQGIRGKLLQLHALRLAAAAKSAIADFRKYIKHSSRFVYAHLGYHVYGKEFWQNSKQRWNDVNYKSSGDFPLCRPCFDKKTSHLRVDKIRIFKHFHLNWAIVEFAEDARHETCSRSMLLQISHNAADSVKSAIPKGFSELSTSGEHWRREYGMSFYPIKKVVQKNI